MKIGFVSLGCAKNLVDSEYIMGLLKSNGHELVNRPEMAEAIMVNTCGFINSAKEESINTILEMAEYKKENCRYLVVLGCLAQRYIDDLTVSLPEVDRFITIDEYGSLAEILSDVFKMPFKGSYGKGMRLVSTKPWTAYLKIADGCSNRCAYCAIPLIRGDYRSVKEVDLVQEARFLAHRGVKELVLIAQDTTRYGKDFDGKYHLLDLLRKLSEIESLHWIRVLYMYPDEITDELIEGMSELPKVLPYFDIPMQHGNDRMLRLMNRRGSVASVKRLCEKIRGTLKHSALRTTMIVGFPTETEEEFNEMMQFVEEVRWDRLGAFSYSKEEDTPAFSMRGSIPEKIKKQRLSRLMLLQKKISAENATALVGHRLEVLIESYDAIKRHYRGRSLYSAPDGVDGIVFVESNREIQIGEFYQVLITKSSDYDLFGCIEA